MADPKAVTPPKMPTEDERLRMMREQDAATEEQLGQKALGELRKQRAEKKEAQQAGKAYEAAKQPYRPFKKGGSVGGASRRADGVAQRGKTKGRFV